MDLDETLTKIAEAWTKEERKLLRIRVALLAVAAFAAGLALIASMYGVVTCAP